MRTRLRMIVIGLALVSTVAIAQRPTRVIGAGEGVAAKTPYMQPQGSTVRLYKDTTYVLTGFYYVDSTATLIIEPGTVIKGDSATQGTLIVRRGGKIYAEGTRYAPIVFTSRKAIGQRKRGDWGGVVILGNAPTNRPTTQKVEGVDVGGEYGGSDLDDNSGIFRYVRIEYPGIVISLNNEINGLTMGGVGRGTTIEYVQVSYSNDDSFEWFGGTVDARHLIAWGGTDDDFDSDYGYSGRIQFAFSKRDPNLWDAAGESNGFESDNDGTPTYNQPITAPVFSNVTMVGPQSDTTVALPVGNKFQYAALLRRNVKTSVHNSVLMGYPWGISIRNDSTAAHALDGRLQVRNLSMQAQANTLAKSSVNITFDPTAWFTTGGWNNLGSTPRQPANIGLVDVFHATAPDPRPAVGSEADTATTDFSSTQLDPAFFASTSYRGAFDPSKARSEQWDYGWTNYNPQNELYPIIIGVTDVADAETQIPESYSLAQNYPNPFNPSTTIRFSLPNAGKTQLKIYDLLGREVADLIDEFRNAGTHTVTFDASRLATGIYFYKLTAGNFNQVRKMMLVK